MTLVAKQLRLLLKSRPLLPAFLFLVLAACDAGPEFQRLSGSTMGTSWSASWAGSRGEGELQGVRQEIEALLEAVNASMSTYRDDSLISTFNKLAVGDCLPVDKMFMEVFLLAREVHMASEGAYDVTVSPLVDLWGFGPRRGSEIPSQGSIELALATVGEGRIDAAVDVLELCKRKPVSLDFSSLAKGYAVDLLAETLEQRGVADYLVEIGGELRAAGLSPRRDAWRVAVEQPDVGMDGIAATLELDDVAVATSGNYRNFFEIDGQRYSHSIDPRTGWPVRHDLVSVTVVHPRAAHADAWATALTVLGAEDAMRVASERELSAYFIRRAGQGFAIEKTPAMEQWLQ